MYSINLPTCTVSCTSYNEHVWRARIIACCRIYFVAATLTSACTLTICRSRTLITMLIALLTNFISIRIVLWAALIWAPIHSSNIRCRFATWTMSLSRPSACLTIGVAVLTNIICVWISSIWALCIAMICWNLVRSWFTREALCVCWSRAFKTIYVAHFTLSICSVAVIIWWTWRFAFTTCI